MIAQNNEYIQSAVATVAELTEDEQIRQRLQARRDFEVRERKRVKQMKKQAKELTETKAKLTDAHTTIIEQATLLSEKDITLSERDSKIAELEALLAKNGISVS